VDERDGVDLIIEQWRRERPELDHAPIGIVGRISRLARELEARLEPVYRDHGLEPGWHDILATLRRHGPPFQLRPTDLTNASMLTSSGTTKRLDKLEQAGLIERSPDPGDRRGTLITLTDAGRELIDRLTPEHLDNERAIISALSEAEQRRLVELLRTLQLGLPAGDPT
jgi:DNA-binding MarR family transcriptional regulator